MLEENRFRFRIIHKGLAVILIPVFLQLLCILWLDVLVEKTEKLAATEAASSEVANLLTDMVSGLVVYTRNISIKFDRGEKRYAELAKTKQQILHTTEELHHLLVSGKDLVISEELRNRMLIQLKTTLYSLDKLSAGIERIDRVQDGSASMVEKLQAMAVLGPIGDRVAVDLKGLMDVRDALIVSLKATRQAEATTRAETKMQILIAIAIEVATTIIVSTLFLKNIADRLNVLVANAKLIPTDQPLTRTVTGSDELAYLDQVLHSSSLTLRRAAEHKRSLMEMVAHDLRSPLMSASLLVESLISQSKTICKELTPRLQELRQTCSLVIAFVEDLLTVDKLEAGKLELDWDSIALSDVIGDCLQQIMPLAEKKNITVRSNIEPTKVLADRRRIQQVLNNLLSNAIKYSPPQSEVVVSSELQEKKVKVLIADQGPGIPKKQQSRLFEKFFQADGGDTREGFGLGLAICNLIIAEHRGSIGVDSQVGKGSTFWFSLPLDED
jgi:signal transduction histidine kinase